MIIRYDWTMSLLIIMKILTILMMKKKKWTQVTQAAQQWMIAKLKSLN